MYTLSGRSCPLNAILAIFTGCYWINGKAGHLSDIMFVCNQFKKVRRTVRLTDAVWADFIGNENSTSMSVELSVRGHWKCFPIKVL